MAVARADSTEEGARRGLGFDLCVLCGLCCGCVCVVLRGCTLRVQCTCGAMCYVGACPVGFGYTSVHWAASPSIWLSIFISL